MKLSKTLFAVTLVAMLSGCGTLLTLPNRNGESYLATQVDIAAIENLTNPHPWSFFPPPLLAPIITGFFIADIPISLVSDTVLFPFDYIHSKNVGFYLYVHDQNGAPVPGVKIQGAAHRGHLGFTNSQGFFWWKTDPQSIQKLMYSKEGFYSTYQEPSLQDPFSAILAHSPKRHYPVLLREKCNPSPMYAKRVYLDLPTSTGSYGYDLFIGDLVDPYGNGTSSDFIFKVKPYTIEKSYKRLSVDITFSSPDDGILRYDTPCSARESKHPQSSYIFPYVAPEIGYASSLLKANEIANKGLGKREIYEKEYHDANYIFRVRSKSGKPVFGRVNGGIKAGFRGTFIPYIEFIYYVNPSGERYLEYEHGRNLMPFTRQDQYRRID